MSHFDCLLAAVLLTGSADVPASPAEGVWAEVCLPALLGLGLDAEILDVREQKDFFATTKDLAGEIKELRRRFQHFAFLPLAVEGQRFPDRRTTSDFLAFNRAYRNDVLSRLDLDAAQAIHLRLALEETERLHTVWTMVRDARCEYYYITVRREALQRLQDAIGAESFYLGRLPPYVPVWRLPQDR